MEPPVEELEPPVGEVEGATSEVEPLVGEVEEATLGLKVEALVGLVEGAPSA